MTFAKHDLAVARDGFDVAGRPDRERHPARNAPPAFPAASHTRFGVPASFPGLSRVCRPHSLHAAPVPSNPCPHARESRSPASAEHKWGRSSNKASWRFRGAAKGGTTPIECIAKSGEMWPRKWRHSGGALSRPTLPPPPMPSTLHDDLDSTGGNLGFCTWSSLIGTVRRVCLLPADERTSLLPASLAVGHRRPSDDTKCSSWKACRNPSGIRPTLRDPPP